MLPRPSYATAIAARWQPAERPLQQSRLDQCILLALLLHVWLVLMLGNAPPGAARTGDGVWGALSVRLLGPRNEEGKDGALRSPGGPVGEARQQRYGGSVRREEPRPPEPGAAELGHWSPRPTTHEDSVPEPQPADAPPQTRSLPPLPDRIRPITRPPEALQGMSTPEALNAPPTPALPELPALQPPPSLKALPDQALPVPRPPALLEPVRRPQALDTPEIPPQVPSMPALQLPPTVKSLPDRPAPPTRPSAALEHLQRPELASTPPLQPAPALPPLQPAPRVMALPDSRGTALNRPAPRLEGLKTPEALSAAPTLAPAPDLPPVTLPPTLQSLPEAPSRMRAPAQPSLERARPIETETLQAAPALPPIQLPAAAAAAPTPNPGATGAATSPQAQPLQQPPQLGAGRPAIGSPEAGANLGHDVATPPSAPASAAPLNLNLPLMRSGALSSQGTRGLLPVLPRPPETARSRNETEAAIDKAGRADCRKAYADLGIIAAVPLAAGALSDKGCRW
ncbi:hypothetical protein [Roseateles violae]|uniref:Uncharacterized protein n=1 Tax=Roseateles violae TaxID=3058042 RepID=A0ABT8DTH1_9BURK|nr:hypothetical protein [Pelomonas sp. PFR6]MDN3921610.1 hypothetical protein [Pelomonas sp. PFR6]